MQNTVAYGLLLPFFLFVAMILPDFLIYANLSVKAHHVATNVIEVAEKAGGFEYSEGTTNVNLQPFIESELERYNLNVDHWEVDYTKGKVDYNQPLQITVKGEYKFKAFDMIYGDADAEVNEMKRAKINASRSGIGQVFFR